MKLLFIGDPHFMIDNIPEVNMFIERLLELVTEQKPDLICIAGDVLHTHERLHTIPLNKAYELIEKMSSYTKTYVLVGNHDMINNRQFLTENHWMNGMKAWENVVIVDKVMHKHYKGLDLVFVPYVPNGKFIEALNHEQEQDWWINANCILAHQEFYGCKMGAIVSVDGDKWPEDYPYVVSGHIHSKQTPQSNIYYTGSAMQHAFGESEKNIIAILSWDDSHIDNPRKKYDLQEFDLALPRKKIVYMDVTNVPDYELPDTKDKIKITLSGSYEEFKAFKKTKKYRELTSTGTKVIFKPKKLKKKNKTKKDESDNESEDNITVNETDFSKILYRLVLEEKNTYLYNMHELIVHNKNNLDKEVFFI